MASVFTHPAPALAMAAAFGSGVIPPRLAVVAALAAVLPDLDVAGFAFGVQYAASFGHRGLSHSLVFALALGLAAYLAAPLLRAGRLTAFLTVSAAVLSHIALDAATTGGLGVAFFWPFDQTRHFLPWRPIAVSPFSPKAFFSAWGKRVILSELRWVWAPCLVFALSGMLARRVARPARRTILFPLLLFSLCLLGGCADRTSTEAIRDAFTSGDLVDLEKNLEETHESYGEMVTALNLARVRQLEGRWQASIAAFEDALVLLEEYENRAIINMRGLASRAGTLFFSRGADEYFGTGYERSLLHTFNSLNYLMLGDFPGAAVEIRRMDLRQELWLEESQAVIEKQIEENGALAPDELPPGYSMRELLRDDAVRRMLNNYQDPFSYSLGAVLYRLAEDFPASDVSMRRAMALDDNAGRLFAEAWAPEHSPKSKGDSVQAAPPRLPPPGETLHGEGDSALPDTQEIAVIAFTGLAPSLGMENVRIWLPPIGAILIDLPAYKNATSGTEPAARVEDGARALVFYPLLRTDLLAYRTLRDTMRTEWTLAVTRAATRAGIAAGTYAAAYSSEETRAYASLVSSLTSLILNFFASSMAESVRNWETLPNAGYLAMARIPRGSALVVGTGKEERVIRLPREARGGIIMATEVSTNNLRVNYVAY